MGKASCGVSSAPSTTHFLCTGTSVRGSDTTTSGLVLFVALSKWDTTCTFEVILVWRTDRVLCAWGSWKGTKDTAPRPRGLDWCVVCRHISTLSKQSEFSPPQILVVLSCLRVSCVACSRICCSPRAVPEQRSKFSMRVVSRMQFCLPISCSVHINFDESVSQL